MTHTIAVTGLNATDNPAPGVPVIRALRAADPHARIVGLAYDALDPGNYMLDVADHVYLVPFPSQGVDVLRRRLRAIHAQTPIDVIVPCLDAELWAYLRLEDELRQMGIGMCLPDETTLRLRDKAALHALGDRVGIRVPKGVALTDKTSVARLHETLRFPVMVKGQFYGADLAHTTYDVSVLFDRIAAKWGLPVIVQEFVGGVEYDIAAVGDGEGGVTGYVPMRKMQLTDKGKAWGGVTVADADLDVFVRDTMARLKWRGPCELEVMRAHADGQLYLILRSRRLRVPHHRGRAAPRGGHVMTATPMIATPCKPSRAYVKPTILAHLGGLANKVGRGPERRTMKRIDGVEIEPLLERFGSPLFVFSERQLRRRYREAYRAFALRYPKVQFSWSYKTNYLDAICRVFHQEGAWAEVVSEVEYQMARRLGVPASQILFNGPYKPEAALQEALAAGSKVHIDHYDELYKVEQIARDLARPIRVSIRVNMDTGIHPRWDRFGFNLDSGEAMDAIRRLHAGGHLVLDGLHSHIGTFVLDPAAYGRAASKIAALALQVRRQLGVAVDYLDLGGGFASRATLHAQYAPGADTAPALDDYAEAVTTALLRAGFPPDERPTLMLETGRAMVDEAGSLITRVVGNKRLANGAKSIIIDAGVNVLFTSFWYRHDIVPVHDRGGLLEDTIVHGRLCMNIDVVRPSVLLPPLEPGDPLVVRPVGAYNLTQSMQFIRLRPAAVLIGEQGEIDVIRRAEDLSDVKNAERLPERLAV